MSDPTAALSTSTERYDTNQELSEETSQFQRAPSDVLMSKIYQLLQLKPEAVVHEATAASDKDPKILIRLENFNAQLSHYLRQAKFNTLLDQTDIWVSKILPFLGPGHYIFVAGVNHRMKELYEEYFSTIPKEKLPKVSNVLGRAWVKTTAIVANTFYSAAFTSVSCGQLRFETKKERECIDYSKASPCGLIAKTGNIEVLKWARKKGYAWDQATCESAARGGNLELLIWARENGCPWNEWTCAYAARGGHLEVLDWARQNGCPGALGY